MKSATYKTGILRTACFIPTLKTLVFSILLATIGLMCMHKVLYMCMYEYLACLLLYHLGSTKNIALLCADLILGS